MLAAGGPVEPFWHLYRQHLHSSLPLDLLAPMRVGGEGEGAGMERTPRATRMLRLAEDVCSHGTVCTSTV